MDLKEFATDFMDTVNDAVINDSKDIEEELTESILDYVIDSGDACAPTVCTFKKIWHASMLTIIMMKVTL